MAAGQLLGRRRWLGGLVAMAAAPLGVVFAGRGSVTDAADEAVVRLVARRFRYEPAEIALRAGQRTVLEITSLDFVHGMKIPDLKLRADLPPGRVTKLTVKFDKPGEYAFLCDNFCGDGHEEMAGKFVVT